MEFLKKYKVEASILLVGLLSINAIFFAQAYRKSSTVDPALAGQLGDFVGGYVGTAFVLISVLLLYRTLRIQRETSHQQFLEAKYFELIKIHRENVSEMRLNDICGRHVFVFILKEFEAAFGLVESVVTRVGKKSSDDQMFQIAYCIVFYGIEQTGSKGMFGVLDDCDMDLVEELKSRFKNPVTRAEIKDKYQLPCDPFEGHQPLLGHYYRHLYQAIMYIDSHSLNIDKYAYVKTLRAQLSTQEQALLFLNSLCPMGKKWWSLGLMIKYRLVKNLPKNYIKKSDKVLLDKNFPPSYFEWQEINMKSGG
ncbi:MAG: putative phage abortive infection protein [Achromobacter sp.]|uniref:putative phage abortive infection protein n=1 Tax=Achromobacter sp. TaxID=134375 RepID=UPI003D032375